MSTIRTCGGNPSTTRTVAATVTALVVASMASVVAGAGHAAMSSAPPAVVVTGGPSAVGEVMSAGKRRLPGVEVTVVGGYARLVWPKWPGWQYRTRWSQPDNSGFGRWQTSRRSTVTRAIEPASSYVVEVQGMKVRKGKVVERTYPTLVSFVVP